MAFRLDTSGVKFRIELDGQEGDPSPSEIEEKLDLTKNQAPSQAAFTER